MTIDWTAFAPWHAAAGAWRIATIAGRVGAPPIVFATGLLQRRGARPAARVA